MLWSGRDQDPGSHMGHSLLGPDSTWVQAHPGEGRGAWDRVSGQPQASPPAVSSLTAPEAALRDQARRASSPRAGPSPGPCGCGHRAISPRMSVSVSTCPFIRTWLTPDRGPACRPRVYVCVWSPCFQLRGALVHLGDTGCPDGPFLASVYPWSGDPPSPQLVTAPTSPRGLRLGWLSQQWSRRAGTSAGLRDRPCSVLLPRLCPSLAALGIQQLCWGLWGI